MAQPAERQLFDNGGVAGNWTHPDWQVAAIGDFNGDTRDDLLLRHSDGTIVEWLGQRRQLRCQRSGEHVAAPGVGGGGDR